MQYFQCLIASTLLIFVYLYKYVCYFIWLNAELYFVVLVAYLWCIDNKVWNRSQCQFLHNAALTLPVITQHFIELKVHEFGETSLPVGSYSQVAEYWCFGLVVPSTAWPRVNNRLSFLRITHMYSHQYMAGPGMKTTDRRAQITSHAEGMLSSLCSGSHYSAMSLHSMQMFAAILMLNMIEGGIWISTTTEYGTMSVPCSPADFHAMGNWTPRPHQCCFPALPCGGGTGLSVVVSTTFNIWLDVLLSYLATRY